MGKKQQETPDLSTEQSQVLASLNLGAFALAQIGIPLNSVNWLLAYIGGLIVNGSDETLAQQITDETLEEFGGHLNTLDAGIKAYHEAIRLGLLAHGMHYDSDYEPIDRTPLWHFNDLLQDFVNDVKIKKSFSADKLRAYISTNKTVEFHVVVRVRPGQDSDPVIDRLCARAKVYRDQNMKWEDVYDQLEKDLMNPKNRLEQQEYNKLFKNGEDKSGNDKIWGVDNLKKAFRARPHLSLNSRLKG